MSHIDVERIVELRKMHGWTQRQLAKEAEIAHTVISRLEAGTQSDVKLTIIVALAEALDVTVDSLLIRSKRVLESDFVPELQMVNRRLKQQPEAIQRQAAGILRGFLETLEDR